MFWNWVKDDLFYCFCLQASKRIFDFLHNSRQPLNSVFTWIHTCSELVNITVSVSAQDSIVALRKAHTWSAPSLRSLPKVALERVPIFLPGWTQIIHNFGEWNVDCFLSTLHFPPGHQCCDALASPSWESSLNLGAPLPSQVSDQIWYLLCLPVYLAIHSHWLQHAQESRSTEVFVAEDYMAVCQSGQPIPDSTICRRFIESENDDMCNLCIMLGG